MHSGLGGARALLMRLFCRLDTITTVYADGGYTGKLVGWAREMFGYALQIVKRSDQKGFVSAEREAEQRHRPGQDVLGDQVDGSRRIARQARPGHQAGVEGIHGDPCWQMASQGVGEINFRQL